MARAKTATAISAIAIPSPKRWRLWLVWARRNAARKTPRYMSTRSASVTLNSTEPDQRDEIADQIPSARSRPDAQ